MIEDYTITPCRDEGNSYIHSETYGKFDTQKGWWFHRENGPAIIIYDKGGIYSEKYYINDKCHRIDGPASIKFNADGAIEYKAYFVLSHYISEEDFYTPGFIDAFILERS